MPDTMFHKPRKYNKWSLKIQKKSKGRNLLFTFRKTKANKSTKNNNNNNKKQKKKCCKKTNIFKKCFIKTCATKQNIE